MINKSNIYLQALIVSISLLILSCGSYKYKQISNEVDKSNLPKLETKSKKDAILNLITIDEKLVLQIKNQSLVDLEISLTGINEKHDRWIVISKGDSAVLKKFETKDRSQAVKDLKDKYRIKSYYGNPNTINPDTSYVYRLPFKEGKKYLVGQSFNGSFSHNSEVSRYAIDFTMKIGEPFHAAREGLVIKTVSHFKEHGGKEFKNRANRILIQHPDGTIASYVHLDYQGVFVSEGERVKRGQKIGLSGFTGYTRGPHLHFVVRKERDIAIPIYFDGYENKILQKGKRYRAKK